MHGAKKHLKKHEKKINQSFSQVNQICSVFQQKTFFFLVGYSTCHWCHVMEHESFENNEIAKILNDHFVSIKVDREERPDVDRVYMTYLQVNTSFHYWTLC